jgi:hypothetical protein
MRSFRGIAIGVALVAMLAGCNGEETAAAPSPSPSASESESPSRSASPTAGPPPTPPVEASHDTRRGAERFGLFFIDAVNHTIATGDTDWFSGLYLPSCKGCTSVAKETRLIYDAGGDVEGGDLVVETYSSLPAGSRMWTVGIRARAERQRVQSSADTGWEPRKGGAYNITLDVTRRGSGWLVTRLDVSEQ